METVNTRRASHQPCDPSIQETRQEGLEFQGSLMCIAGPCLGEKKDKNKNVSLDFPRS
jgi:hypothetical protein